jgi:hypothetical protein
MAHLADYMDTLKNYWKLGAAVFSFASGAVGTFLKLIDIPLDARLIPIGVFGVIMVGFVVAALTPAPARAINGFKSQVAHSPNRESLSSGKEIVTKRGYETSRKILPSKALDKQAVVAVRHSLPALDPMSDSNEDVDLRSFVSGNLGFPNYCDDAEKRLIRDTAETERLAVEAKAEGWSRKRIKFVELGARRGVPAAQKLLANLKERVEPQ